MGWFDTRVEDGCGINGELLFDAPGWIVSIGSPRPFVGTTLHTDGVLRQLYFGLDWDWYFANDYFSEAQLGGSLHDRNDDLRDQTRHELGCSLLFRLGVDLEYRFEGKHAVMLHLDYISNGSLCDQNDGMEFFGVRYDYRF